MSRLFGRRLSYLLVAVAIAATSCSSSGSPISYDDQIDETTGFSNVEMNWMEGCSVGLHVESANEANAVCSCSFERIKEEIPFADFVAMNDRLRSNVESLRESAVRDGSTESLVVDIARDCIADR